MFSVSASHEKNSTETFTNVISQLYFDTQHQQQQGLRCYQQEIVMELAGQSSDVACSNIHYKKAKNSIYWLKYRSSVIIVCTVNSSLPWDSWKHAMDGGMFEIIPSTIVFSFTKYEGTITITYHLWYPNSTITVCIRCLFDTGSQPVRFHLHLKRSPSYPNPGNKFNEGNII